MRRATYATLAQHPHAAEVAAVVSRLAVLTTAELTGLADNWSNTVAIGKARDKALSPETPLVVDVLRIFDDLSVMFADELDPEAAAPRVSPARVGVALKAARDAVAATVARPVLSRKEFNLMIAPWRAVVGSSTAHAPVNPNSTEVDQLVAAVAGLAGRCHTPRQAEAFDRVLMGAITRDREDHADAVDVAYAVATESRRQRTWWLTRERVLRALEGGCRTCPSHVRFDGYERERVADLCADAACGLLVSDLLPSRTLDVLLDPLAGLVDNPRPPLGA